MKITLENKNKYGEKIVLNVKRHEELAFKLIANSGLILRKAYELYNKGVVSTKLYNEIYSQLDLYGDKNNYSELESVDLDDDEILEIINDGERIIDYYLEILIEKDKLKVMSIYALESDLEDEWLSTIDDAKEILKKQLTEFISNIDLVKCDHLLYDGEKINMVHELNDVARKFLNNPDLFDDPSKEILYFEDKTLIKNSGYNNGNYIVGELINNYEPQNLADQEFKYFKDLLEIVYK